jgi:putative RNA 2'-phosphotransferase
VSDRVARRSRRLSWLLRHGAGQAGLAMNTAGWAPIDEVMAVLGIDRAQLDEAVERNDKRRLEVDGDRIRACQGHSLDGMPVTRAALEATWRPVRPSDPLWHGTGVASLAPIAARGLHPGRRSHVHLAAAPDSRVGKRARVDLLLGVDPARLAAAGLGVFEAPNGVLLVREVPAACITELLAASASGTAALGEGRRLLGLAGS